MDDRLDELERSVVEAQAYMAALAIVVSVLCEDAPPDPAKVSARLETLHGTAPPAISARAAAILAALLPAGPVRPMQ
jgi:hypothetical protein